MLLQREGADYRTALPRERVHPAGLRVDRCLTGDGVWVRAVPKQRGNAGNSRAAER